MMKLELKNCIDINKESATILPLSSGKIDTYKFFKGQKILPSDQRRVIEQAKFTCSHLEKTVEKQRKTTEDQGEKQRKTIGDWGEK